MDHKVLFWPFENRIPLKPVLKGGWGPLKRVLKGRGLVSHISFLVMTDSVEPSLLVSFFLIVLALKGSI